MWFGLCLSVWLLAGYLAEEADLEVVDVVVGEALVRHVALARLEALALHLSRYEPHYEEVVHSEKLIVHY